MEERKIEVIIIRDRDGWRLCNYESPKSKWHFFENKLDVITYFNFILNS